MIKIKFVDKKKLLPDNLIKSLAKKKTKQNRVYRRAPAFAHLIHSGRIRNA